MGEREKPTLGAATAPIAVTMGEPAGIGAEIALKAWLAKPAASPFFMIDDPGRLADESRRMGENVPVIEIETPGEAAEVFERAMPVYPCPLAERPRHGHPTVETAAAVTKSIDTAVDFTMAGKASAVVTLPIQKSILYEAGFRFPGHTEYLAELTGADGPPVMMLLCEGLRVVPVSVHVGLAEAVRTLSSETIIEQARITAASLARDFAVTSPKLAVAGLNPHAGENGALGDEETRIISPAITALRSAGIDASGPYPPDTLFSERARKTYDAAICMYHDQALIPIKTLDFDGGVNATLGLPIVRTSPDHGTALNLAGRGEASERSLLAALGVAARMAANRASFETGTSCG